MRRYFIASLAIIFLLALPGFANVWFRPAHQGPGMVNADLTPERVFAHYKPQWNGTLVLWEGRIKEHILKGGLDSLTLGTVKGSVPVKFSRAARNLEYDRTGYRAAIKGYLRWQNGRPALEGQSVILLEPPLEYSYKNWTKDAKPNLESFLAWRIQFHNPEVSVEEDEKVAAALVKEAKANKLDPLFFASLLQIESAWDTDAVSTSGAQGLGQLMPFTASGLNVTNPLDPVQNLKGSARMVAGLFKTWQNYPNTKALVLASYNAGPNRVRQAGGQIPAIPETTNYVYFIGYVNRDMSRLANKYNIHWQ